MTVIVVNKEVGKVIVVNKGEAGSSGTSDHTLLSNIGTNTHTQIDTALNRLANTSGTNTGDQDLSAINSHVSSTSNPHSVTKSQVGLSNVDNTSDANKPVSTATQTALNFKANLASPALTGTPTAPTASNGTSTAQIATTAFVDNASKKPYYSTATEMPVGNSYGTALDLASLPEYSTKFLVLLDAGAASGSGVILGTPAENREIVLVNESPETISIYPLTGTSIHPDALASVDQPYYLRGYATARLIGRDTTSWRLQVSPVDLDQPYVFGTLGVGQGGTGTVDGSGLPYLGAFGTNGNPALGTYQFDVQAFGQFQIYDSNSPTFEGFTFLTNTTDPYLFEMRTLYGGGRVVASDTNNLLVYFGGTPGGYDGLAWDAGTNRLQTYGTFLVGAWEFDGGDVFGNSDGILTAYQLKYWDSSVFDISPAGINFMNSNVNIASIANGGNLGVGASASSTRKIWSLSTSNPQLSLAYNNTTAFVDFTVSSTGGLTFKPAGNATIGFRWQNAAGTTDILSINTTNTEISMGIGANTVGFFRGGSNVTPQFALGASGGKAVSLLAGTSGAAFAYDSTGTFAISTDTRANIVAGTSSGGTQRIGMTSAGLVKIGAGTAIANLDVEPPSGSVSVRFKGAGQSTLELNDGTSNYIVGIASSVHMRPNGTQIASFKNNGVAIGVTTTTPSSLLHVAMDTAAMPTIDANTGLIISNASATGDSTSLSIIAGATGYSTINFGDTADENIGYIQYGHTANDFTFGVSTNPRMYINNTGVGAGVSPTDTLTVGSATNGTNVVLGIRTLTSGGSSMRTLMTQNASTGALDWAIDQGGNGSARAFNLTLSGVTALAINSAGALTLTAGQSIGSSSAKNIFNASTATTVIDFDINASSTANNTFFRLGNGTMSSASSGVSKILSVNPTVNQSGTAGYTALAVNVIETGTGSGAKNLTTMSIGGVEKFSIDNGGIVKASAQVRLKGYTVAGLPAGTQGDTAFCTDLLAPTYLTAVVGGGAVVGTVFYNGTAWVCG